MEILWYYNKPNRNAVNERNAKMAIGKTRLQTINATEVHKNLPLWSYGYNNSSAYSFATIISDSKN